MDARVLFFKQITTGEPVCLLESALSGTAGPPALRAEKTRQRPGFYHSLLNRSRLRRTNVASRLNQWLDPACHSRSSQSTVPARNLSEVLLMVVLGIKKWRRLYNFCRNIAVICAMQSLLIFVARTMRYCHLFGAMDIQCRTILST